MEITTSTVSVTSAIIPDSTTTTTARLCPERIVCGGHGRIVKNIIFRTIVVENALSLYPGRIGRRWRRIGDCQ
jgi:hypothetical protein